MKLRRFLSCILALLLVCGLPLTAFADTWYLEDGNIAVSASADESGTTTQTVTQGETIKEDSAPVITQRDSSTSTTNTVTINADTGATANVTLDGVNINTSGTGEAAVEIKGNGNVVIELDGSNTVQSGNSHAGVEKNTIAPTGTDPGSGNGNLTITDENGTQGSLNAIGGSRGSGIGGGQKGSGSDITITGSAEVTANGGEGGSGIGGGQKGSGSDITITGSAEVTAQGGDSGSGIGGGQGGSGSYIIISGGKVEATGGEGGSGIGGGSYGSGSDITITGNAEVTAKGGLYGSGIGGGGYGSGSDITITGNAEVTAKGGNYGSGIGGGLADNGSNITISGSAEVTAKGGASGSGIGGGSFCSGSDITISEDAQVKAQGGEQCRDSVSYFGVGAAIGDGGKKSQSSTDNIAGEEKKPNTDSLTTNGKIEYYAPDADMETDAPYKIVTGTYVPPQPTEPVQPTQPEEEAPQPAQPLYRVVGQDGKAISYKAEQSSGVLTITVDADFATLTGSLSGMKTLKAQGVDTIVFVTKVATSTFAISDLLAQGGDSYALTHDGAAVTFTLGSGADISKTLK